MIVADTMIWSSHFRKALPALNERLRAGEIALHPWIVGELALAPGIVAAALDDLLVMPQVPVVPAADQLAFVRLHRLRGVGWVDSQLLIACLTAGVHLWTEDQALADLAARFEIAAPAR